MLGYASHRQSWLQCLNLHRSSLALQVPLSNDVTRKIQVKLLQSRSYLKVTAGFVKEEGPICLPLFIPRASFNLLCLVFSSVVGSLCKTVSTKGVLTATVAEGPIFRLFNLQLNWILALALALGYAVGLWLLLGSLIVTGLRPIVVRLEVVNFGVVTGFPLQILVLQFEPKYMSK